MTTHYTTRRSVMKRLAATAAVTAAPVLPVFGQNAEFTYKYANNMQPMHPVNTRLAEAVKAIREETGGRMELQIFPANQLGSDTDVLSQLRSGGVEMFNLSGLILATLIPTVSISAIGFAFKDYDAVWKAIDGELGAYVRSQIAKVGLVGLENPFDNGFRQMTSSVRPIHTPDDLKGFKMRVPVSPMSTSLFKSLGASPVAINAVEMYTALQTGIADGQENAIPGIITFKLQEVQKYCSITNHMWDGFWCLANRRAWEKLPENIRAIVAKHVNAAAVQERADLAAQNDEQRKELEKSGMVFNTTQPDDFRKVLNTSGFYTEWKKKMGSEGWAALERAAGESLG